MVMGEGRKEGGREGSPYSKEESGAARWPAAGSITECVYARGIGSDGGDEAVGTYEGRILGEKFTTFAVIVSLLLLMALHNKAFQAPAAGHVVFEGVCR